MPNFCITSFDLNRTGYDGTLELLLKPLKPTCLQDADAVIVPFTWLRDFKLDEASLAAVVKQQKPVIVLDYLEHSGIDHCIIMGRSYDPSIMGGNDDYRRMHEMLKEADVRLYFKRELPSGQSWPPWVKPCDFIHGLTDVEPVSEDAYHARPLDLFMAWGFSHVNRAEFHGALLQSICRFGWGFAMTPDDTFHLLENPEHSAPGGRNLIALLFLPWWRRTALEVLMDLQGHSKISISLYGNGHKCFRSAEAPHNSVMFHQGVDTVLWSYPWVHAQNCVNLPDTVGTENLDVPKCIEVVYEWLRIRQGDLYPIYLAGLENNRKYRRDRYLNDYLLPYIEAVL